MKKMSKLLFVLSVVVSLFYIYSVKVFAEDGCISNGVVEVQQLEADRVSRARACSCGNGTYVVVSTVYGAWTNYHQESCIHKEYGTDMIQRRSVTKTYKCNYCGRGYSTMTYETRRICHGYN